MNIYSSPTVLVERFFHNDARLSSKSVMIFTPGFTYELGLPCENVKMMLEAGYDVVFLQTSINDYHQSLPLDFIQKLSITLKEEYTEILGFGASMGGYAALAFSQFFNFSSILVFGPYYSILEEFDNRYPERAKKTNWIYHVRGCGAGFSGKIFVAYDPYIIDKLHYEKIEAEFSQADVTPIPIRFGSHPPSLWLKDAGVYDSFVLSIFNDGVVPDLNQKKYRINNKIYLTGLGHFLANNKNKYKSALYVLHLAVKLGDNRHGTYNSLSILYSRQGDYVKAVEFGRLAVQVVSDAMNAAKSSEIANKYVKYCSANEKQLSKVLRKSLQFTEAYKVICLARARNPKKYSLLIEQAKVLFLMSVHFFHKKFKPKNVMKK